MPIISWRNISVTDSRILKIWEAFAVGDAMGMPTEFMTLDQIEAAVGSSVTGLIPAELSQNHGDLPMGSVTDDTEQNLYLLRAFRQDGRVTADNVVEALKAWIRETDAVAKHYIGPSSIKALKAIDEGTPAAEAGMGGTTCGGIMRTPAAVLWKPEQTEEELADSIYYALIPTHNSSEALEAAGAYGFALKKALDGGSMDEIFAAAEKGAAVLMARAPWQSCAPSSAARLRAARTLQMDDNGLKRFLFDIWGTGLPSADVCGAVFAIFARAGKDVMRALSLGTTLGGDTDTTAALAAALSAAYAGGHNIPQEVTGTVLAVNRSLFSEKLPEALHAEQD